VINYTLNVSAIVCGSVVFLPSTFRAWLSLLFLFFPDSLFIQGGSNMTGTGFYVNKPHCAAAV